MLLHIRSRGLLVGSTQFKDLAHSVKHTCYLENPPKPFLCAITPCELNGMQYRQMYQHDNKRAHCSNHKMPPTPSPTSRKRVEVCSRVENFILSTVFVLGICDNLAIQRVLQNPSSHIPTYLSPTHQFSHQLHHHSDDVITSAALLKTSCWFSRHLSICYNRFSNFFQYELSKLIISTARACRLLCVRLRSVI